MSDNTLETTEIDQFQRNSAYEAYLNEIFPYPTSLQSRSEEYNRKEYERRRFEKEASNEAKRRVAQLEDEVKNLKSPDSNLFWSELSNYPCITHVTSPGSLSRIFKEGISPVRSRGQGGAHAGFDEQFPELGLTEVVHCGWGGIDQFSAGASLGANVILLIKNKVISPDFGVTHLDWTKWGAFQIYKYGGGKLLRDQVVNNYLRSIRKAGDLDLNPYNFGRDKLIKFLYRGWEADSSGVMPIPTIFIPKIEPQDIEAVIIGGFASKNNQNSLVNIPADVPQFNLDDLATCDIYGIEKHGNYFAQMSQRARFAQAKIAGREDAFLKTFTLGQDGPMDEVFRVSAKYLRLKKDIDKTISDALPPERL